MATLFKNSNSPYWRARYYDANGKRTSRSTGTTAKRAATKIANRLEAESRTQQEDKAGLPKAFASILETAARDATAGTLTLGRAEELMMRMYKIANPDFVEISLGDFWDQWIQDQKDHVSSTAMKGYREDKAMMGAALGKKALTAPLRKLRAETITKAKTKAHKGRKAATVNKALSSLRRALEAAVTKGLASANPAKQVRMLTESDSTEKTKFTTAEVRAMLDHEETSDEWRGAILIAAHTGLRMGDIVLLGRGHIEESRIVIVPGKTRKKRKDPIEIPITPPVASWIGEREGNFFPTLSKLPASTRSTIFRRIMDRAEVPREITLPGGIMASRSFHSLRHTFASWLAEADVHADVRQKLTGHSTASIHARYSHHDEALDRAVASLPNL